MLLGGHTVRDPEIKFGYAITGLVDVDQMMTNAAGRAGDVLVLTKPLGTGIVATALKAGRAPEAAVGRGHAVDGAAQPHPLRDRGAERRARRHRHHRLRPRRPRRGRSPARAGSPWRSAPRALPLLPGALELAPTFQPGGLKANRRAVRAPRALRRPRAATPPCRPCSSTPRPRAACSSWCRRRTATPSSPSCPTRARSASRAPPATTRSSWSERARSLAAGRAPMLTCGVFRSRLPLPGGTHRTTTTCSTATRSPPRPS